MGLSAAEEREQRDRCFERSCSLSFEVASASDVRERDARCLLGRWAGLPKGADEGGHVSDRADVLHLDRVRQWIRSGEGSSAAGGR